MACSNRSARGNCRVERWKKEWYIDTSVTALTSEWSIWAHLNFPTHRLNSPRTAMGNQKFCYSCNSAHKGFQPDLLNLNYTHWILSTVRMSIQTLLWRTLRRTRTGSGRSCFHARRVGNRRCSLIARLPHLHILCEHETQSCPENTSQWQTMGG